MRKWIGMAFVAAAAVVVLALPVQAAPIAEPVPSPRWLNAAEAERVHPADRLRLAPQAQHGRTRQKRAPMAHHIPGTIHWSTSQAFA